MESYENDDWFKVNSAIRTISSLYQQHVRDLVDQVLAEIDKKQEVTTAETLRRYFADTTSGDSWMQNSLRNRCIILASSRHLVVEEFAANNGTDYGDHTRALAALQADVKELLVLKLEERGVTLNRPWICPKCQGTYSDANDADCCAATNEDCHLEE